MIPRRFAVHLGLLLGAMALGCAPSLRIPGLTRAPAWEAPPPPVTEGPVVPTDRLHRATLENGLEILILEDHSLPRVDLGLVVRRGAGIEEAAEAGLASLTAEVMKRGAGDLDALGLARAVDDLGASLSVGADWDSMSVGLGGLSEDRERLFEILMQVARAPRFDPQETAQARDQRLAALERAKDSPQTLVGWEFARTLYPGHRYGLPLDGNRETVSRLDAAAARAFHRRVFVAANAILYWVGDVDAAWATARARAAFGDWPAGDPPPPGAPPPAPAPPERRIVIVDRPELVQTQILVGHEGISRTDADRVALGLLNTVLGGGGFFSRLMDRVRAEEGLTYSVGSAFSPRRHPGPFSVGTFTRVAKTREVVDLLLAELARLETEPPTPEELATAKSLAAGRFVLGMETAAAIADGLVDLRVHDLPDDSLDTYRTRLRGVTPEEVARLARERMHPERAAIVVVGPAQQIRPQLEDLGPVEVVKP